MKTHLSLLLATAFLGVTIPSVAKEKAPEGILAASVGDHVVLADPAGGWMTPLATGPVGWLHPAPGGILFAPDVINGRTTVINLRTRMVADRMDGLSMPHFGETPDRYIALAGGIIMVSYPDRAVLASIPATIAHPWQVIVTADDAAMLVLDRLPDGSTGVNLTTVNLITRQVVYRRPLIGDIVHMALSPELGLLALADAGADRVRLVEPATLTPVADYPTPGPPRDVVFADGGKVLVTAVATAGGGGILHLGRYKSGKKGLKLAKETSIGLTAAPVRIDRSPGGDRIAVALDNASVVIVDVAGRVVTATIELPGTARDLRWCDPTREGPMVPDWSDGEAPELDLGGFETKVRDDKKSGLEPPRK